MKKILLLLSISFLISCVDNRQEIEKRAREIADSTIKAQRYKDSIDSNNNTAENKTNNSTEIKNNEIKIVNANENFSKFGYIEGEASYPSEGLPENYMIIINSEDDLTSTYIVTLQDLDKELKFKIKLPVGTYDIYAQAGPNDQSPGIYSKAVLCGLSVDCKDHSKIPVIVKQGQTTKNINPADWYY
jgi:hypothetical protein